MQIVENGLFGLAIMLGIAWPAVFLLMLIDKLRGTSMGGFFSGGRYHLPKNLQLLSWHQHLILLPLYCVFFPCLALYCVMIIPPMYVFELGTRLWLKWSGKLKAPKKPE
jgi:hypothetical protein